MIAMTAKIDRGNNYDLVRVYATSFEAGKGGQDFGEGAERMMTMTGKIACVTDSDPLHADRMAAKHSSKHFFHQCFEARYKTRACTRMMSRC